MQAQLKFKILEYVQHGGHFFLKVFAIAIFPLFALLLHLA
jgi:hypothetical protein